MPSSKTVNELREKRTELETKRERLKDRLSEISSRIDALEKTLELFQEDSPQEKRTAEQFDSWPSDANMPDQVLYVLEEVGEAMMPRQVDEYVRENSEDDVRDNAVAETMSRLARQGRLQRKEYGSSSYHYGLPDWWNEEDEDFVPDAKPNRQAKLNVD